MLKQFLNERKERVQKLIDKGFEVEIKFGGDTPLGNSLNICIVHTEPWFCVSGTYWTRDEKDYTFTAALEAAEKFDIDKTAVDDFVKSLSK